MAGDPERQIDPFHDLRSNVGRDNFRRLLSAEVRTMADTTSKGLRYKNFRRAAVKFLETHYTDLQFDALIPYMAMTIVDRVHLQGKILTVIKTSTQQNDNLFFTCCLLLSWKLRSKRLDVPNVLRNTGDQIFAIENVITMEVFICQRLDWLLRPVMPFRFIDFFAPFITLPPSPSALRPVYQLIVTSQFDPIFTQFRPSVMAFSAMLVYTLRELPDQVENLRNSVNQYRSFANLQTMIDKCQLMLEPLYRASTDPNPYDAPPPTIPEPEKSEAKDTGSSSKGKDIASSSQAIDDDDEEASRREGKEPAADDVDDEILPRREGKEPAADDDEIRPHREGKEIVEEEEIIGSQGRGYNYVADLMRFPLGWIDAQAMTADSEAVSGCLAGKLELCCNVL